MSSRLFQCDFQRTIAKQKESSSSSVLTINRNEKEIRVDGLSYFICLWSSNRHRLSYRCEQVISICLYSVIHSSDNANCFLLSRQIEQEQENDIHSMWHVWCYSKWICYCCRWSSILIYNGAPDRKKTEISVSIGSSVVHMYVKWVQWVMTRVFFNPI